MRELTDSDKLSFRSIPEVFEALTGITTKLRSDKSIRFAFKGKPKVPTRAAVVNAVILKLSRLSREEQRQFIAEGMDELNKLMALDAPSSGDAPAAGVTEVVPGAPKPKKERRKSAG